MIKIIYILSMIISLYSMDNIINSNMINKNTYNSHLFKICNGKYIVFEYELKELDDSYKKFEDFTYSIASSKLEFLLREGKENEERILTFFSKKSNEKFNFLRKKLEKLEKLEKINCIEKYFEFPFFYRDNFKKEYLNDVKYEYIYALLNYLLDNYNSLYMIFNIFDESVEIPSKNLYKDKMRIFIFQKIILLYCEYLYNIIKNAYENNDFLFILSQSKGSPYFKNTNNKTCDIINTKTWNGDYSIEFKNVFFKINMKEHINFFIKIPEKISDLKNKFAIHYDQLLKYNKILQLCYFERCLEYYFDKIIFFLIEENFCEYTLKIYLESIMPAFLKTLNLFYGKSTVENIEEEKIREKIEMHKKIMKIYDKVVNNFNCQNFYPNLYYLFFDKNNMSVELIVKGEELQLHYIINLIAFEILNKLCDNITYEVGTIFCKSCINKLYKYNVTEKIFLDIDVFNSIKEKINELIDEKHLEINNILSHEDFSNFSINVGFTLLLDMNIISRI